MPKKKKKAKKRAKKPVHYVQLRTHRQWPNEQHFIAHLEAHSSSIHPLVYDIDRLLNEKWINIRRPQFITELKDRHQQEVTNDFRHRTNLIAYKYSSLNDQFDANDTFLREGFIRALDITDHLVYLYQQVENGERNIYEYRLEMLKSEFEQEQQALKDLFITREINELNNQINVLNAIEQDDVLQQIIQFKLDKRNLEEDFVKDLTMLHADFTSQFLSLRSTVNKTIRSKARQTSVISKQCHDLAEKTRQSKERIDEERKFIVVLKRKIHETNQTIDRIEIDRNHLRDKLDRLKHCSQDQPGTKEPDELKLPILKTKFPSSISRANKTQLILRRFSVLTDDVHKSLQKKLLKAERILLLLHQCRRLESEEEKLLTRSPHDSNRLDHCQLQLEIGFDDLALFYKRYAHVQMDLYIRREEHRSRQRLQRALQKQLTLCF